MDVLFSVLYVLGLLSFLVALIPAGVHWRQSQTPLGLKFLRANSSFGVFLVLIAISFFSLAMVPEKAFQIEIFFNTFFFLIYAWNVLTFPPFLSELLQAPWNGPPRVAVYLFASLGVLIPLMVHALCWDSIQRLLVLRFWLNSIYLPLYLAVLFWFFLKNLLHRHHVTDRWKRTTLTGTSVVFFFAVPFFAVDALWPLFQVEWKILPRGANLSALVVLLWNSFFVWRWATFPGSATIAKQPATLTTAQIEDPRGILAVLSVRERELALLVLSGLKNQEVAARLNISLGTVKVHIYNIFNKTGVSSRKELRYLILPDAL